ncbi:NlpC/P60 family protein [Hungatella effluvii]|uniref:C40 family peptidase n=1 Tax=Hungatella effluvii TaxID=1096246 RepID=UPI0022E1CBA5|nr:NlpC/P60 family protein [Hungatella effluvii]
MAAPAVIIAVKAAALAVTDHRARITVASVIMALLLPFILVIVMIMSLLDGTSTHNVSAIDAAFHGGAISAQIPEEYRVYLEDIRQSFTILESIIGGIDHIEDGEVDGERVKSIFYSMFFGEVQPSKRAQEEFVNCFVEYEERQDQDGDSYMAAIPITDMEAVYRKIQSQLGQTVSYEQRSNAQRIYNVAEYGLAMPGGIVAGSAMGDGSYQALIAEATKYIGYPYRWGGSTPQTSFDCSGYICWIFTQSNVYNMPRTSAYGIFTQCAVIPKEDARPGDLIFFTKTYASSTPVSHVGLYIGNNQMLHCGDPIGYANINSTYWRSHFYAFGRLSQ